MFLKGTLRFLLFMNKHNFHRQMRALGCVYSILIWTICIFATKLTLRFPGLKENTKHRIELESGRFYRNLIPVTLAIRT